MSALSNQTIKNLEYLLKIDLCKLDFMSVDDELMFISDNIPKKKIRYSKKRDNRKIGRGNPLLARKRFRTMEDVNRGLDKIK